MASRMFRLNLLRIARQSYGSPVRSHCSVLLVQQPFLRTIAPHVRTCASLVSPRNRFLIPNHNNAVRLVSTSSNNDGKDTEKKPSIFQRFKQMYRDYWYVLLPVHVVTSVGWFAGFYYMAKSGIDVVALLEAMKVSEVIINPLKDSSMGYIAVAYALYKIATPLRYTVTLAGTTISINHLKNFGYIKPVPSTQKLKEMYNEKKDTILYSMKDKKEELKLKTDQLRDHTDQLIEGMEKKIITKIQDSKEHFHTKRDDMIKELEKGFKNIKKESHH